MAARTDWEAHLAGLDAADPLPVYALVGSSLLLRQEAVRALRERVVQGAAADFNRDELQAGAGVGESASGAARTLPVMAKRRWVHLSDVHKLVAKEQAPLLAYLQEPVPSTVLCLSGEKLDLRTKLGMRLGKSRALFAFEPPRPADLPLWVSRRAAQAGYPIENDAASLLAELVGGELGSLVASLDKVALFAGDNEMITAEHVAQAVAATRVSSIFELTDAVGRRDRARASAVLRNILDGGDSGLVVLSMLVRQLRHLTQMQQLTAQRASPAAMAQAIGVPPFLLDGLRQQARRFDAAELHRALAAAAATDVRLKSSRLDPSLIMEDLLLQILEAA